MENEDLGILIISEWNNDLVKNQIHKNRMRILSNYTNSTQYPILSKEKEKDSIFDGSNVPNLNSFLLKYDIALSQDTISGNVYLMNKIIEINSGTSISLFPKEGLIFGGYFDNDESIILDSEDISINQNINSDSNNEIFIEKKNSKIKKDKLYRAVLGVLDGVNKSKSDVMQSISGQETVNSTTVLPYMNERQMQLMQMRNAGLLDDTKYSSMLKADNEVYENLLLGTAFSQLDLDGS